MPVLLLLAGLPCFAQTDVGISGEVLWDRMEVNAVISLDLASAGIRIPAGRTQAESLLAAEYLRLIGTALLGIQVDSSRVIGDLIAGGEWTLADLEALALGARAVPSTLSPSLDRLSVSYILGISGISGALLRHRIPIEPPRTLSPVAAPAFTGILIIASDPQRVHGREGSALMRPALFPKIWDTEMNLIFEKNMLDPAAAGRMRYFTRDGIFVGGPSGLSPEVAAVVGDRPLRVFAHGVFGASPTDPILGRDDALAIISREENRRLLREGKVAIILDSSVIREQFRALPEWRPARGPVAASVPLNEMRGSLDDLGLDDVGVNVGRQGLTITMDGILFQPDSAEMIPGELDKIREIAEVLRNFPEGSIVVSGHTALAGSPEGRMQLSLQRATAVAEYLVTLGVRTADRISVRGYGADMPLADNDTDEGRRINRRVEITVLDPDSF